MHSKIDCGAKVHGEEAASQSVGRSAYPIGRYDQRVADRRSKTAVRVGKKAWNNQQLSIYL